MPLNGWDHFSDPISTESIAVSEAEDISTIRRSHSMQTLSNNVQLLRSDILGYGTFQTRINMTQLQKKNHFF